MNDTRQVVVLLFASFLTFTIGSSVRRKGTAGTTDAVTIPEPRQLAGWALLTILLLIAVDLDTTAEVATALTWLIFLSIMLLYGVDLFNKLSTIVGEKPV